MMNTTSLLPPKITLTADHCEATITSGPLLWSIYLFRRIEQLIIPPGEATKQNSTRSTALTGALQAVSVSTVRGDQAKTLPAIASTSIPGLGSASDICLDVHENVERVAITRWDSALPLPTSAVKSPQFLSLTQTHSIP
jgi:hypothetical protein